MTVSPVFHNTRPEGELPPQESAAFDLLDTLGIDYDRVSHDAAFNMELCAQVSDALGVSVCKNLFLCNRQQTKFYLLCMSPDKVFHTKELSAQINSSRLSFAPGLPTTRKTGCSCSSTGRCMTRRISPAIPASAPAR